MSTETPILDDRDPACPRTAELIPQRARFDLEQCASDRNAATLAMVDLNLRISTAQTHELLTRGVAIVCKTTEMVAFSRQAIARSRVALGVKTIVQKRAPTRR